MDGGINTIAAATVIALSGIRRIRSLQKDESSRKREDHLTTIYLEMMDALRLSALEEKMRPKLDPIRLAESLADVLPAAGSYSERSRIFDRARK